MEIRARLFLVAIACFLALARGQETRTLALVQTIALPSVQGGLNHMAVDAGHQRLFVPAPGDKRLEIVDLRSGRPWRSLASERPAAARYVPEFDQLYVSSGRFLYVYSGSDLALIARLDLQSRLDELEYDAQSRRLYAGCMTDGETGIAVIALPEGRLVERIPLPASPQGIALGEGGKQLFANLPDTNQIEVISLGVRKTVTRWRLGGASDNFPMALNELNHRLFVACRTPAELVVLDTRSGKVVARIPCVGDADDAWYDAATKRIYVSGGEGLVSVIEQQDADHYRLLGGVTTVEDAATSVFSTELTSLYVGVPRRGNSPAELLVLKPGGRP
jgi:DNA-binding beta-propeller fold protein YncE